MSTYTYETGYLVHVKKNIKFPCHIFFFLLRTLYWKFFISWFDSISILIKSKNFISSMEQTLMSPENNYFIVIEWTVWNAKVVVVLTFFRVIHWGSLILMLYLYRVLLTRTLFWLFWQCHEKSTKNDVQSFNPDYRAHRCKTVVNSFEIIAKATVYLANWLFIFFPESWLLYSALLSKVNRNVPFIVSKCY